jgi:hypothetical protein
LRALLRALHRIASIYYPFSTLSHNLVCPGNDHRAQHTSLTLRLCCYRAAANSAPPLPPTTQPSSARRSSNSVDVASSSPASRSCVSRPHRRRPVRRLLPVPGLDHRRTRVFPTPFVPTQVGDIASFFTVIRPSTAVKATTASSLSRVSLLPNIH